MSLAAFADHVKSTLGIKYLKTSRAVCDSISRVAVVPGSGGSFLQAAKAAGADALVTGEAKHHHFLEAAALGVLLAEAGHYDTERWFTDRVFMSLQARVNEVQLDLGLKKAAIENSPYVYQ
jgi:putative NIF3 family GTP cyclohydrolase 1 type 2